MKYQKPEMAPVGKAMDLIASGLAKNNKPMESELGPPFPTDAAAYQSDE